MSVIEREACAWHRKLADALTTTRELEPEPTTAQLADALADALTDATPGDPLPSERVMSEWSGLSRHRIRDVLAILEDHGRIRRGESRQPARVIRRMPVRVIDSSRYLAEVRRIAAGSPNRSHHYATELGADITEYQRIILHEDLSKPSQNRTPVLRRTWLETVEGEPVQMRSSELTMLTDGPVDPVDHQPPDGHGLGAIEELAILGHRVRRVEDRYESYRTPTAEEIRHLRLPADAKVTRRSATYFTDAGPVLIDRTTIPGPITIIHTSHIDPSEWEEETP